MPSNVNYRANICALKILGCTHVLATTATGSLKQEIVPGSIVILDDVIDRTKSRVYTFFDGADICPGGISLLYFSLTILSHHIFITAHSCSLPYAYVASI